MTDSIPTPDAAGNNTAATAESTGGIPASAETEATQNGHDDQITFTKEEVDQLIEQTVTAAVQKRLTQERRQRAKDQERAGLSEAERLKAELADRENELNRYRAKDDFLTKARETKIDNPQKVYEMYSHRLEFDDKGRLVNLDAVIQQARTDIAELLRGSGVSQVNKVDASARSSGSDSSGHEQMNQMFRRGR